jgi:hypothetical protein
LGEAASYPSDFRLVLHDSLSDSYEMSKVLLARASFDGTLQLLTSGWERMLGYRRGEINGRTLFQLMWCNARNAAAAVAAILDRLNGEPAALRVRCRNGLGEVFTLYAVNIWLRFSDPASLAVGIGLSAIGLGALSASSWRGDERIRVYKK